MNDYIKMPSTVRPANAIYNNRNYGPTFGGGHDLHLANNAGKSRSSYSNLGYSYKPPSNYRYGAVKTKSLLAGSYNFYVDEYEVYYYGNYHIFIAMVISCANSLFI